jgi:hypothetical protein
MLLGLVMENMTPTVSPATAVTDELGPLVLVANVLVSVSADTGVIATKPASVLPTLTVNPMARSVLM